MQLLRRLMLLAICAALLIGVGLCENAEPLFNQAGEDYAFAIEGTAQNDRHDSMLLVRCENHTDHPLTFGWAHVSVMGCMYDPLWTATVEADSVLETDICFEAKTLAAMGVDTLQEVEFTLSVLDAYSWDRAILLEQAYTLTLTDGEAAPVPRIRTADEQVLIDTDELLLSVLHAEPVMFSGFDLDVCLENRTGRDVLAKLNDTSINGVPTELIWTDEISAGKRLYTRIHVPQYLLSVAQIRQVEEIAFTLQLLGRSDWTLPVFVQAEAVYHAAE